MTARTAGESSTTGVRGDEEVEGHKTSVANLACTGPEGQNWDMSRKTALLAPGAKAY